MVKIWNERDTERQENFTKMFADLCNSKQAQGRALYGDTFQGNPIIHLTEELADAVNYLAWLSRSYDQAIDLLMRANSVRMQGMEGIDVNLGADIKEFVNATVYSFKQEVD